MSLYLPSGSRELIVNSVLNVKAVVAAFNQEKALVGWIVCSSTLLSADQFVPRPAQVCVIAAGGDPGLRRCRLSVTAAEKISELYGVEVRAGMKLGHDISQTPARLQLTSAS